MSPLTRDLSLGSVGDDVKTLQKILNADSSTMVASSGTGSKGNETTRFGPATASAVKKFQDKYSITTAAKGGYGRVGPSTRKQLNQILGSL
jgi:peptidoglycan hydrolase-like protein with peptidoglycan-binding domain